MVSFNKVGWISSLRIRQVLCDTVPVGVSENYKQYKGDLADASCASVLVRDRAGRGITEGQEGCLRVQRLQLCNTHHGITVLTLAAQSKALSVHSYSFFKSSHMAPTCSQIKATESSRGYNSVMFHSLGTDNSHSASTGIFVLKLLCSWALLAI